MLSIYRFPLHVSFTAIEEREFIFRLVCNIKGKRLPLSLNVKAEGYGINMSLSAIDSQGEETQFSIDKASKRIIDFGKVSQFNISIIILYSIHIITFTFVVFTRDFYSNVRACMY